MKQTACFDLLVVGGGPAGAAAAITTARAGHHVALAGRARRSHPRGETLGPAGATLRRLGAWDAFRAGPHLPCHVYASAWGSGEIVAYDLVREPGASAWRIDRASLEAGLRAQAEASAVEILDGANRLRIERVGKRWQVRFEGGNEIGARFLIDASGRAGVLARRLGAVRLPLDRQVATIAAVPSVQDDDPMILVEAVAEGWWYSARVPGGEVVGVGGFARVVRRGVPPARPSPDESASAANQFTNGHGCPARRRCRVPR